jgi:transcriptional regulator with XRE-family HTH domain
MDATSPILCSAAMDAAVRARRFGAVVRLARTAQHLTLEGLGARCGYSASTLSRLERGKQPLRDVVVLQRLAEALSIPPELLGITVPRGHAVAHSIVVESTVVTDMVSRTSGRGDGEGPVRRRELLAGIAGLAAATTFPAVPANAGGRREQLIRAVEDFLHGAQVPIAESTPLPLLRSAVIAARRDYQAARYERLSAVVPPLIAAATATRDAATGDDRAAADTALAEAYLVASHLMVKVNADGLALVAADRAVQAAQRGCDPLTLADSRRGVAVVLRRTGRRAAAQNLVTAAAEAIAPARQATPEQLSVYGLLLSTAAYTAAVDGNRSAAQELIGEAAVAAARLGRDADYRHTSFGPTNVAVYQIGIAHVLGDSGTAVQHAGRVNLAALRTPERRGRYWVDLARAYHQWGKPEQCYRALLAAEAAAPADVRYRPPVHRMTEDLLRSGRRHSLPDLRSFAARIGLPA